jgi:hypothetical protein
MATQSLIIGNVELTYEEPGGGALDAPEMLRFKVKGTRVSDGQEEVLEYSVPATTFTSYHQLLQDVVIGRELIP